MTAMTVGIETISAAPSSHVVHFYEHEAELARTVGRYLCDAATAGAVAVVLATDAHREAFEEQLANAGIDPAQSRRDGSLILLDAAATMSTFMREGQIDSVAFRHVVGALLRQATETGKPVRAYGEMVALLWEAGNVLAAIELEELWNDLGRELEFSLLCAYHGASTHGDEHEQALQQICQLHSSVVHGHPHVDGDTPPCAGTEASAQFPAAAEAPGDARHFVTAVLEGWGCGGLFLDDAKLIVTELATNAVMHADSPFSVLTRADESGVRITVGDCSISRPAVRACNPLATSGRGLQLVRALAVDWGVEFTAGGKTVWAELDSSRR
jgi:anti-sigma regulatory factor (Ser/Thr protein kinase)